MAWEPKIVAAHAFTSKHFTVAYGELDYDDPFTAVLEYNEAFSQPWSRTEMAREIKAIAPPAAGQPGRLVAASDEGDIYFIGDNIVQEKIPGVGVASPDATGAGGTLALALVGNDLLAAGQGEQLYKRDDQKHWNRIAVVRGNDPGFRPTTFIRIAGASEKDFYLLGIAAPEGPQLDAMTEEKLMHNDDWGALSKALEEMALKSDGAPHIDEGRVHHWDGAAWRRLDLATTRVFYDAYLETPDKIWLVGTAGAILVGNARDGFHDVGGTREETFLSITGFQGGYVLASDHALFAFDGQRLTPLKPKLRRPAPNPFKIQGVDGILCYFDYKQGIHRFDGQTWDRISIPPELLERPFKGLRRAKP